VVESRKPELLSPAGDWAGLTTSVENGADSVYFGVRGLNMRDRADSFDASELGKVMDFLRGHSRRGYLALNTIILQKELPQVREVLVAAKKAGVDAVILWDMAVLSLAKELGLKVHLSTQASVANFAALKFFVAQGVSRAILARECTLPEIRAIVEQIREQNLPCEIETFIHGAMCLSISGRCFLSAYSHAKSANRGQCYQPCRREYHIQDKAGKADYRIEDDRILSPQDLCTIDFIDQLIDAGIDSFKIEGRLRSPEYAGVVTASYRRAIDAYAEGQLTDELKAELRRNLASVYNRGFSNGFYFGAPTESWSKGLVHSHEKIFLGDVQNFYKKISVAEIRIRAEQLVKGDQLLFVGKESPARYAFAEEIEMDHQSVAGAKKGDVIAVKLPFVVRPRDQVYLWRKVR